MNVPTQYQRWIASLHDLPVMARVGWVLYAASMLTPGYQFHGVGAQMWLLAPRAAIQMLGAGSAMGILIGAVLLIAVASNVTVFIHVPRWMKFCAIFAPWLPLAILPFADHRMDVSKLLSVPCFFPWATGVAMINLARLTHRSSP